MGTATKFRWTHKRRVFVLWKGAAIRELFTQEVTSSWRPRDKCFNLEVALEDDVRGEMKLAKDR